ncbi:MAG: NAD(P)H-dependent oxidoreductase [Hyphomicrobiales bacterium]
MGYIGYSRRCGGGGKAVSAGGSELACHAGGRNRFEIRKFLAPFDQTTHLCGMGWLEPFAVFAARRASSEELSARAGQDAGVSAPRRPWLCTAIVKHGIYIHMDRQSWARQQRSPRASNRS